MCMYCVCREVRKVERGQLNGNFLRGGVTNTERSMCQYSSPS